MCLKTLERLVCNIINKTRVIILQVLEAMLKMTDFKLELIIDVDMFQFNEKGMRGGEPYIANRYSRANNKYIKDYNEKAPSKYIMYLDANNIYGWAMSQYLPTGGFRWLTENEINKIDLAKYKRIVKRV